MIDDQSLIEAIDGSPLANEDKKHWKNLIPKLTTEQRERLYHSLVAKTEIARAVILIEKALNIIAEAEAEAEKEVKQEEEGNKERKELLEELDKIKKDEETILLDENILKQKQEQTHAEIRKIRDELKKLSIEVHGQAPPSYAPKNPQPLS